MESEFISQNHTISLGVDLDAPANTRRYRVLLVEDDPDTVLLLKQMLMTSGFDVTSSYNGAEGLRKIEHLQPDITLLDIMMPGMDGWEMLERLRQTSNLPVIVLSAISQKEEVVRAFRLGADDYITKPFYNDEVIERVRTVLRRSSQPADNTLLNFPEVQLVINQETRDVLYRGQNVELTPKEYGVLLSIARRAPQLVTYETLRLEVWGENLPSLQNRVKYLVFILRQKFGLVDPNSNLITTVGRRGYRLRTE